MNQLVVRLLATLRRRSPYDDWKDVYNAETRRLPAKPSTVPDYYERFDSSPSPTTRRAE